MNSEDSSDLQRAVDAQTQIVVGLRAAVFSETDPTRDERRFLELAVAEDRLAELQRQRVQADRRPETSLELASARRGALLGEETTGLRVEVRIRMDPVPTGVYHLLDPATDPLLTVHVENCSRIIRRVCVEARLDGLSATAARTIEIAPRKTAEFDLLPTLFPDRARTIVQTQRATLDLQVKELGGELERRDTYTITCLARSMSFNAARRPDSGEMVDLSHYYGAWVTPHVAAVQKVIRQACEFAPDHQLPGYQGDVRCVEQQVAALYRSLQAAQIVYVNSVIDFGAPFGIATQRTRLPRESLGQRSANCIDGTVLLASLME